MTTATLAMKDEMPIPACAQGLGDATAWRRDRFDPPALDIEYPSADISMGQSNLIVDYSSLRFSLDAQDQPTCWDELVIVD